MVCFGCLCFIIFVLFFSLKLSELILFILKIRYFNRNKITVSVGKLTFASFEEVGLTGAGAIPVTHVHFSKESVLALHVLNFCRAKWLEDAILQYSAQVRHTQEYLQYSLVLIKENRNT